MVGPRLRAGSRRLRGGGGKRPAPTRATRPATDGESRFHSPAIRRVLNVSVPRGGADLYEGSGDTRGWKPTALSLRRPQPPARPGALPGPCERLRDGSSPSFVALKGAAGGGVTSSSPGAGPQTKTYGRSRWATRRKRPTPGCSAAVAGKIDGTEGGVWPPSRRKPRARHVLGRDGAEASRHADLRSLRLEGRSRTARTGPQQPCAGTHSIRETGRGEARGMASRAA